MRSDYVDILRMCLYSCNKLSSATAALDALELLRFLGFGFTTVGGRVISHPEAEININGSILPSLRLKSEKIAADPVPSRQVRANTVAMSFLGKHRRLALGRDVGFSEKAIMDPLAESLLSLGAFLYPHFSPKFIWIDELSGNVPEATTFENEEIKYIYWVNFFGPNYVERYGRAFLLDAPGWKSENLADGGILYVTTQSFHEWWKSDHDEIANYFRKKVPQVEIYKAKLDLDPSRR